MATNPENDLTKQLRPGNGALFFASIFSVLGLLLTFQYINHGYITLKNGTALYGFQAVVVSFSFTVIGTISLVIWLKKYRAPSNRVGSSKQKP